MEDDQTKQVVDFIQIQLGSLRNLSQECCIYRAPEHLRQVNEEAYRPLFVAIGPYFYSQSQQDPRLQRMQQQKLRFLEAFLGRREDHKLHDYVKFLREKEKKARGYYAEKIRLTSDEFITMLLLDAAFIIEYFAFRNNFNPAELVQHTVLPCEVARDLLLEENQLPFFILKELYKEAFQGFPGPNFINHTLSFISQCFNYSEGMPFEKDNKRVLPNINNIKHLVDFLRLYFLPSNLEGNVSSQHQVPKSASTLRAAGVKFVAGTCHNSVLDIKFSKGVLEIPKIFVQDTTESAFRSIMLFEQCHSNYSHNAYFTNYVSFLESLINTTEDVQVLVHNGIIQNYLGSDEAVVDLFNNIAKHIGLYDQPKEYYATVSTRLNEYAATRWHRWKAILNRNYFNHPWSIISVIYAIVLLILTLMQAISGFTSAHPKEG